MANLIVLDLLVEAGSINYIQGRTFFVCQDFSPSEYSLKGPGVLSLRVPQDGCVMVTLTLPVI